MIKQTDLKEDSYWNQESLILKLFLLRIKEDQSLQHILMSHWNALSIPKVRLKGTICRKVLIKVFTWLMRAPTSCVEIQELVHMKPLIYISLSTRALKNGKFKTLKILELDWQEIRKMIRHLQLLTRLMIPSDQHNMKRTTNSLRVWKARIITLLHNTARLTHLFLDQELIKVLNLLLIRFPRVQQLIKWDVEMDYSNWNKM